jgi:RHS repeat-associated protein
MKRFRSLPAALFACCLLSAIQPAAAQSGDPYNTEGDSNTTNNNPTPKNCCTCITLDAGKPAKGTDGNYTVAISWEIAQDAPCDEVSISGAELTQGPGTVDMGNTSGDSGTISVTITAEEARDHEGAWKLLVTCGPDDLESTEETTGASSSENGCEVEFKLPGCGDGNCSSDNCDSNGEPDAENPGDSSSGDSSFTANIPTTQSNGGMTSGNVRFLSSDFDELGASFTFSGRAGLVANVPTGFAVTRDSTGLTSIDTGAATLHFADVPGQSAFTITHKDAAAAVFRTTTLSHVEEGGIWRLRLDSEFDNATTRYEQTRPAPGQFTIERGRVVGGAFQSLRRETSAETTPSPGVRVRVKKIEERAVSTAGWQTVSEVRTKEENQLHGWVKTEEVIDPAGAALTSTWFYYQPGDISGPGGSTVGLGRLKQHIRHDGYESFHTYSLNQEVVTSPYAGNPAGQTTTTIWNPTTHTRTTIATVNGHTLSHTVSSRTGSTDTRSVHTSADQTLTTTTHYIPSGQDFGGNPLRTLHPDGTLTTHSYTREASGGFTTITENGSTTDDLTVTKGTRTTTVTNSRGTTILSKTEAIGHGTGSALFASTAVTSVDQLGRALTTAYFPTAAAITGEVASATSPAWTTTTEYSCCGIAKEIDRYGITTYHAYDSLQRRIKSNRLGVTTETVRNGLTTETHRYAETVSASLSPALAGTPTTLVSKSGSNLAGTLQESWSPDPTSTTPGALVKSSSTATTYKPAAGLSTRAVTTVPGNHIQTTDSFLDGRTATTSGDLSPAMTHSYSVNATGEVSSQSYLDGANLRETTTTQSDWAGRTRRVTYMDNSFAEMAYNDLGQVVKSSDPDGVATLFGYNPEGERTITAIDRNRNGLIDYGSDTVSFSETEPGLDGSNPAFVTTSKVWQDGDTSPTGGTVVSTSKNSPNGLSSSSQSIGVANPSTSLTLLGGSGNWTTTSTAPDSTYTVTTYTDGLMDISENFGSDDTLISFTSMRDASNAPLSGYDLLNRPTHQRDSRTGVTITAYLSDTADIVKSMSDPGNRTTSFIYDIRGRRTEVDAPDTLDSANITLPNITTTHYFPDGSVQETTGDQTYRTTHTYDYADRQKTMTTYGTQTATTTWIYSPTRGFLVEKNYDGETDNGSSDADFEYTAAGRLYKRTWERGAVTTYGHDDGGRLETVTYSNETGHTTPNLVYTYDALGRLKTVTRGGVLHAEYTYRPGDLQRLAEIQQIDTLNQAVTYTYEDGSNGTLAGRPNGYTFGDGIATWSYDGAGRLSAVTDGTDAFAYGYRYVVNGGIHEGTVASGQGVESFMPFILEGPQVDTTLAYESTRNTLAFRKNDVSGGTLSKFAYSVNALGQRDGLTPTGSAFATTTPFAWGYNLRGELTTATRNGLAAFERGYSYDGIGNRLSATDHTGAATSYFADTGATTAGGNALNQYGKINYPGSNTLQPVHDVDGNMTSGPVPGVNGLSPGVPIPANATLTWDAENRLVKAVVNSTTVNYGYDHQSRLISRTVGGTTTRYLYDGWNCIAEYTDNGTGLTLERGYLWGMDLSGNMQGAGGVGGLLSMRDNGTTPATYYPTYDGNGNVSEYVDQSGAKAAHFEYDPFGNLTVDSESNAAAFAYRFSTKPQDLTTGLYYYQYRWYDPATGRWPSRDPIAERGGGNLYGFARNNAPNKWDYLGKYTMDPDLTKGPDASEVTRINASFQRIKARMDEISDQVDSIKLCVSTVGDTHGVQAELDNFKDTADKIIDAINSGRQLELEEDDLGAGVQAEITTVIGNVLDTVLNLNINPSNRWSDLNDAALDPLFLHEISHDAADTEDDSSLGGKDAHTVDDLMTTDICAIPLIRHKMPKILRYCCCPSKGSH